MHGSAATTNAVEFLQAVNPMQRPDGDMDLGDCRIRWQATVITNVMDGSDYPRGRSFYELALYETVVRAYRGQDEFWFEFKLKQVGFKKVRALANPFQPPS